MIYTQLFTQSPPDKIVQAGVIGTGHFATAVITQSQYVERLHVPIVADLDVDAARLAYQRAALQMMMLPSARIAKTRWTRWNGAKPSSSPTRCCSWICPWT